jgi:hypothetical protein
MDYGQALTSNQAYPSYAGHGLKSSAPKPMSLGDQLKTICQEVSQLRVQLSMIADRVSGSSPTGVDADNNPTSSSHMGTANEIIRQLSQLRDQVNRLEGVL